MKTMEDTNIAIFKQILVKNKERKIHKQYSQV